MLFTQEELDVLRQAAEHAWGDDTRHPSYQGHPRRCLGQCYVTARWVQSLHGGKVARKDGHYFWLSANEASALDLAGDAHLPAKAAFSSDPQVAFAPGPVLYKAASDPRFAGAEVVPDVVHERTARFVRRANRALEAIRQGVKLSIDFAGDALPGNEPQYTEDHGQGFMHDDPTSVPEAKTYNVVYANGELHLSAEDSHDDLARHALIEPNHTGPFAAGFVTVDPVGRATWALRSNVALNALMRVLKEYGKTVGWDWGGLTDATGQPISDEFAPKKARRLYWGMDPEDELVIGSDPYGIRLAHHRYGHIGVVGAIDIEGNLAKVAGLPEHSELFDALKEWADDEGLRLMAGDNVLKRIEDLQTENLWSPTDNEPEGTEFFHEPKRDERSPGGVFKCPECAQIFPNWHLYRMHRMDEEPVADSSPDAEDGGFPDLPDMDKPLPNNFTPRDQDNSPTTARVAVIRTSRHEALRAPGVDPYYFRHDYDEHWTAYMGGWPVGAAALEGDSMTYIESAHGYHVTDALLSRIQRAHESLVFHAAYITQPDGVRVSTWEADDDFYTLTRMGFVRTSKTRYKWSAGQPDPSKELEGAVPFIYDVDKDKIYTGAPGERHADIQGKFTPAGIVEGLYEPGGKVIIRSITNMPYTVRHLLELWYYSHPEYVIKSVHLRDDAGQDTKLAKTAHDGEHCPSCGAIEEYQDGLCYSCGHGSHPCPRCDCEMDHQRLLGGDEPYCPQCGYEGGRYVVPELSAMDARPPGYDGGQHPAPAWTMEPERATEMMKGLPRTQGASMQKRGAQEVGQYIANLVASDDVAYRAYQALRNEGGHVFAVGGAVRDALMGKAPKDIDLMVTGLPSERVLAALKRLPGQVKLTGQAFGVYRYRSHDEEVEVSLPRRERSTGPQHTDFDVQADHTMTPQEDFYRRDFTVNAMGVDLDTGTLMDPFNGADDIEKGQFRTLNANSLSDDPLRTLRALALRSRHGLEPDEQTKREMREAAGQVVHEPAERIMAELDKVFGYDQATGEWKSAPHPAEAIRLAHETGVLKYILPEVDAAFGYNQDNPHHEQELGEHLLSVLEHTVRMSEDPDLRLAALLHDIGKPASRWNECRSREPGCQPWDVGHKVVRPLDAKVCHNCGGPLSGHYYGYKDEDGVMHGADHEAVGAEMARERLDALKYPVTRQKRIADLISHHMYSPFTSEKGARKFLAKVGDHADDLMTLRVADQGGKSAYATDPTDNFNVDRERQLVDKVRDDDHAVDASGLAINGHDIVQHLGIKPGPQVGQILRGLTDAVIEDPDLNAREALLERARQMAA